MWPDWAIYWTLGNFSKLLAKIILPKSPTFLGNFCEGVEIYIFLVKSFWATFRDIWRLFTGHTAHEPGEKERLRVSLSAPMSEIGKRSCGQQCGIQLK